MLLKLKLQPHDNSGELFDVRREASRAVLEEEQAKSAALRASNDRIAKASADVKRERDALAIELRNTIDRSRLTAREGSREEELKGKELLVTKEKERADAVTNMSPSMRFAYFVRTRFVASVASPHSSSCFGGSVSSPFSLYVTR